MIIRSLSRQEVENDPGCIWNAFIDLLATEDYDDLSATQRPAHLVFWYEQEVQNGGHLQYFENRGTEFLEETIEALQLLGDACRPQILREAGNLWLGRRRPRGKTTAEFGETALEGEFAAFDLRFHQCTPALQQLLEAFLSKHQVEFIQIT